MTINKKEGDAEKMILQKYKGLRFIDPEDGNIKVVWPGNLHWVPRKVKDPEGETYGWHVLGYDPEKVDEGEEPAEEDLDAFDLEIVQDSIRDGKVEQTEEVKIIPKQYGDEGGVTWKEK